MTTVTPAAVEQYQFDTSATKTINKELGQEQFLELMTTQLQNQDPMKPMENGDFLGQMAQFSTVTGIEAMQESLQALTDTYATSQTLQATQLVGQEVLIENDTMELGSSESVNGAFELDVASGDVKVDITSAAGTVVEQLDLGQFNSGRHTFTWDGTNDKGERMPAGLYKASVSYQTSDGYETASVLTSRVVDSVEFGAGGQTTLTTLQGDELLMDDIRQIRNVKTNDTPS